MTNMFGIPDDILMTCFGELGRDHDAALDKVLGICRQANVKLKKDKCLFRCTSIPFLGEIISQQGVSLKPRKGQALRDMSHPNS